jgi:N-acetylglucosamine kinase-like BadF-type ATPase
MDGGGTKTAFVLLDRNGTIRATHHAGSAFYLETGMEALRTLIHEGIRAVLRTAGITVDELDYAYFGLPVHGEDERTAELDRLPEPALGSERYACGNDMVCGWAGSLACQDGINVVAGTGSICYGEYAGRSARSGGWGELFSDEGSAYWIARSGLTLFTRMSDGSRAAGPLYELVASSSVAGAISARRLGSDRGEPGSRVAALARLVHRAAGSAMPGRRNFAPWDWRSCRGDARRCCSRHAARRRVLFRRRVWHRPPGDRAIRECADRRRTTIWSRHVFTRDRRGALRRQAPRRTLTAPALERLATQAPPAAGGMDALLSGRTVGQPALPSELSWPCCVAPRSRLGHGLFNLQGV